MRGGSDAGTNALLGLIAAAVGLGVSAYMAARAACALGSCTVGAGGPSGLLGVLTGRPAAQAWQAPGMPGWLFWIVWTAELGVIVATALWVWRRWGGVRQRRHGDPRRHQGLATPSQVRRHFSAGAVEKMVWLRPDITHPRARELGMRLGTCGGRWVWVPVEDSVVVTGPSRGGKGRYVIDPMVAEYPGAVVTTSVRAETAAKTVLHRQGQGPIAVFCPGGIKVGGPAGQTLNRARIRWSLFRGCESTETALRRARALAANGGPKGGHNDEFWSGNARMVIAPLLHAAALTGADVQSLARWASRPGMAEEAVSILASHPDAASGWAEELRAAMSGDDRTVANIWATVRTCISEPLMDPAIRESISPGPGEELDITDFIGRRGTLYIVGDAAATSAPLVAALIEDVYAAAVEMANRSAENRLTPPLGLILDEINNIATLPSLPTMMSAGGGSNITTVIVEQSRSQSAARLGRETAEGLFDSATTKIITGGATRSETLNEVSSAVGEREVRRRTVSTGRDAWGASTSWAEQEERVLTGAQVRELPKGSALVLKASAPALIIQGQALDSRARRRGRRAPVGQAPERIADLQDTVVPSCEASTVEE